MRALRKLAAAPVGGQRPDAFEGAILLFDGGCLACNRWVAFLARRTSARDLLFASIESPLGRRISGRRPGAQLILERQGTVYAHSDALIQAIALSVDGWRFLALLRAIPVPIRDVALRGLLMPVRGERHRRHCYQAHPEIARRVVWF